MVRRDSTLPIAHVRDDQLREPDVIASALIFCAVGRLRSGMR